MSDNGRERQAFEEDALKQALSEPLETPVHSEPENSDHSESVEPADDAGEAEKEIPESMEDIDDDQNFGNRQQTNSDDEVTTENTNGEDSNILPTNESDHHFYEDTLKQALGEPLEIPVHSESENSDHSESVESSDNEGETKKETPESMEDIDEFNDQNFENKQQITKDNEVATESANDEDRNISPKVEGDLNFTATSTSDSSSCHNNTNNNGISQIVMTVIVLSVAGFTAFNWMANQTLEALKLQIESLETRMNNSSGIDADQVTDAKAQHVTDSEQENEVILMQMATQIRENREAIKALKQPVIDTAITVSALPEISSEDSIVDSSSSRVDKVVRKKVETTKKVSTTKRGMPMPETPKSVSSKKSRGWNIILTSLKNEVIADRELATLLKSGQQVEKHTVKVHGETFHQLRTGWFERKDDALAYLKKAISDLGYRDAWIRRTQ